MGAVSSCALTPQEVRRWTRVGVLAALALLLSYAETFVPIPIPGVKLGLANIAVLAALVDGDIPGALSISLIKVLAAGFLFGSPLTMAYSAAGTLLAFVGMAPLSRLPSMHVVMLSIVGALLHEVGQLLVAQLLLNTTTVWYLAPVLLVAGCITGAICGVLASRLDGSLAEQDDPRFSPAHAPAREDADMDSAIMPDSATTPTHSIEPVAHASVAWLLVLLVAVVVVLFHLSDLRMLAAAAVLSVLVCLLARVRPASLLRSIRPILAIALLTLVLQLVASPQTALVESVRALLRLTSIAALCVAFMTRVPTDDLSATVAWVVCPLQHLGIRTTGFVFAFDVAIRLVPTLGTILAPGEIRLRDVPQLVPQAYAKLMEQAKC